MSDARSNQFDVDRALGRLARRVRQLGWGTLAGLALCAGLWWWAADLGLLLWSHPLQPRLDGLDLPAPLLNASGTLDRGVSPAERGLAVVGSAILLVAVVAWRKLDRFKGYLVAGCAAGLMGLVLVAQSMVGSEQRVNRDVQRLAESKAYAQLVQRMQARPGQPYSDYVTAQALVLSGQAARLRDELGPWLRRWSEQGARFGFLGAHRPRPGDTPWEGSHASPEVMRALEIAAFGAARTPFAEVYERDLRRQRADARSTLLALVPAAAGASLAWVGLLFTWRRARQNRRLAEQWVVKFDYYRSGAAPDPAAAASPGVALPAEAPASLPPIEFVHDHEPVPR